MKLTIDTHNSTAEENDILIRYLENNCYDYEPDNGSDIFKCASCGQKHYKDYCTDHDISICKTCEEE